MPNTPTTPASVASRLTDSEIGGYARVVELSDKLLPENKSTIAAVLRDYIRLRKLEVKLIEELKEAKQLRCGECWFTVNMGKCPHSLDNECVARRWHNIIAEAEKGDNK